MRCPTIADRTRRVLDHPLPYEESEGWSTCEGESPDSEEDASRAEIPAPTEEVEFIDTTLPVQDDPHGQEEGGFDQPMPEEVDDRATQPLGGEESDSDQGDPRVADRREGKEPLQVPLQEAHDRPEDCCHRPDPDEDRPDPKPSSEYPTQRCPIDLSDCVEPESDHDPREEGADWGRCDCMRIGQPEVEGDSRGLDQEPGEEERRSDDDEPIGSPLDPFGQDHSDLDEVECARPCIEERDPDQDQEGADTIGDCEVERAFEGRRLPLITGQTIGRDTHQLEEDEEIEEIAGQGEADHPSSEGQDERVVESLRSEEHTSELQSRGHLVCRLLLEKKKKKR